jgi:hypothetical protein
MTNNQFKEITNIIDNLETKGLFKQADSLNNILIKIAQQTQPAKPTPEQIKYYQDKIKDFKTWANELENQNIYENKDVNIDPNIFINNTNLFDKSQLTSEQLNAFTNQAFKIHAYLTNTWSEHADRPENNRHETNNVYEDQYIYNILRQLNISTLSGTLNPQIKTKQQLANLINQAKKKVDDSQIKLLSDGEYRDNMKTSLKQALDQVYNLYSIRLK